LFAGLSVAIRSYASIERLIVDNRIEAYVSRRRNASLSRSLPATRYAVARRRRHSSTRATGRPMVRERPGTRPHDRDHGEEFLFQRFSISSLIRAPPLTSDGIIPRCESLTLEVWRWRLR
jgi:hypothetical protein